MPFKYGQGHSSPFVIRIQKPHLAPPGGCITDATSGQLLVCPSYEGKEMRCDNLSMVEPCDVKPMG